MVFISVLKVDHLNKKIGKRMILDDISFEVGQQEIVGLVGPNGAGKTTLIKTIMGLYRATSGKIEIDGVDINKNFELAMSKIGAIIENPDMYLNLTGYQNLKLFLLLNGKKDFRKIHDIAKLVKLSHRMDDKVKTYSLGMRQRLGIAQAIIKEPKILILDEPTNGLDPIGIQDLREIIQFLNREMKMTILISSHILQELEQLSTRIIMIDEGKMIDDILIEDLKKKNQTLEREFNDKANGSKKQIK